MLLVMLMMMLMVMMMTVMIKMTAMIAFLVFRYICDCSQTSFFGATCSRGSLSQIIMIICHHITIITMITINIIINIIIIIIIIIIMTGTSTVQFDGSNQMTIDRRQEIAAEAQDITLRS